MNAQITLAQIGKPVLTAVNARGFMKDRDQLIIRVGPRNTLAKIMIKLDPSDTYSVRLCEMNSRTLTMTRDETRTGVYCDDLADVVLSLVQG